MSESKKKYLVRSANQILGPYSEEEIKNLVKEAVIAANDEVAAPCSFWLSIENHSVFKDFMATVDFPSRLARFLTNVSGKKILTVSKTFKDMEKTQTATGKQQPAEGDLSKAEEVDFEILEQDKAGKPKKTSLAAKYKPVLPDERKVDVRGRRQTAKAVRGFWHLIILIALGSGAYILFTEFVSNPAARKRIEKIQRDIRKSGAAFYQAGDYEKAFSYFEEGLKKDILRPEEKIFLASLIARRGQGERAEALARDISQEAPDDSRILLVRGLTAIAEKDFSRAEDIFMKTLDKNPKISLLNLALLKWRAGEYKNSQAFLDRLMEEGYERGVVFYLRTLNLIGMSANKAEIKKNILNIIKITPEYHQELYALLARLHVQERNLAEAEQAIKKCLNEDPFFFGGYSGEYQYNSFLALDILDWEHLLPYCADVFKANSKSAVFSAFYGFCHLKSGKIHKSFKYIERAKNQAPRDPLILSIYAYSLLSEGDLERADTALKAVEEGNEENYAIPHILKARLFEREGKWQMAEDAWGQLLYADLYHLSALAGMAFASFQLGNQEAVIKYRDRGLEKYPHHVRLLSLKESAEN